MNPIKSTIKTEIIPIALTAASVLASFYFYSVFPNKVPSHWNINGEVDAYSGKAFGAFFFPVLIVGIYLLFLILPYLDPKKERYIEFYRVYHIFKGVMVGSFVLMYFDVSAFAIGWSRVSPGTFIPLYIGLLFIVIGNYLPKIKTNWFMGIRTPWTLSSEIVWRKTHQLSGKLFILGGLDFLIVPWINNSTIKLILFIGALVAMIGGSLIYSYIIYRKENNR